MNWIVVAIITILMQTNQTIWDVCPLVEPVSVAVMTASSAYEQVPVPISVTDVLALTGESLPWTATRGFYARQYVEYVRYALVATERDGERVYGWITRNVIGEWFVYLSRYPDVPHADCGAYRLDDFESVLP